MKVLIISGSLPLIRCGVGDYVSVLLENLLLLDVEPNVLSSEKTNDIQNVQIIRANSWSMFKVIALWRQALSVESKIVHIQYPAVGYGRSLGINILPYFIRLFGRKRLVVTLHEYYHSRWLGRIRNLITILPAHKIIVSNSADADSLPFFLRKRVDIVPVGSSIAFKQRNKTRFEEILRSSDLDYRKPVVCFFGFPFPSKRIEVLLQAAEMFDNYQLILICELSPNDSYQKSLLEKIKKINNKNGAIGVTGYLSAEDVSICLQESKAFITAADEPLTARSTSAIAAALHGCVVIAKKASNPTFNKPFVDSENAVLLPDIAPRSIATAVNSLDSNKVGRIKKNSIALEDYFSWPNIAKQHVRLYKSMDLK